MSNVFDSQNLPPAYQKETHSEKIILSDTLQKEIEHWLAKYPATQRQSAIVPVLLLAQRYHHGWLPRQLIDLIADYIGMPRMAAYEVATFYSMLELKPIGKHKISICTNVSCMLNGSDCIVQQVEKRLQIKLGETTADQRFTLREVECLGACVEAPVMLINERYHTNLTPASADTLLDQLEKDIPS